MTILLLFTSLLLLLLLPLFLLLTKRTSSSSSSSSHTLPLPPGSLGLPIIGQSLALLAAMRANTAEQWLRNRARRYGPISKLSLFGKPTVFLYGQAANRLVFGGDGSAVANEQTQSIRMILGERSLLEMNGEDHRRVRGALGWFLKVESLKRYVGKMDDEVRRHIQMHWDGKHNVTVLPLMKTLTFNIICSLLFGLERGKQRDQFLDSFQSMIGGMWSIPINVPFTRYNRSLRASTRIQNMLKQLVNKKKMEMEKNDGASSSSSSSQQDLITCLLGMRDEEGNEVMSEKEIIHNVMLVMVAGHDTSSVLITFILRLLANEPSVYEGVLQEQEEIAKSKVLGEALTWEDLAKMKYTWRVANETLRMFPPIFGGFRKALKDIEYGGYIIPKGWQESRSVEVLQRIVCNLNRPSLSSTAICRDGRSAEIFWVTAMTHMDKSIFPEPHKFDPSRFENQSCLPPFCFIPFGGGQRICPGYEFARIETLVAIHYLVTGFTWKLCADDFFMRDPMPIPTQGLPLQICPRKLSY